MIEDAEKSTDRPVQPPRAGEAAEREAFDLQLGARRAEWLAKVLDSALSDLAPPA